MLLKPEGEEFRKKDPRDRRIVVVASKDRFEELKQHLNWEKVRDITILGMKTYVWWWALPYWLELFNKFIRPNLSDFFVFKG